MKKQFVEYDIAVTLKQKGFKEPCLAFYDTSENPMKLVNCHYTRDWNNIGNPTTPINGTSVSAPLYQQVVNWLFEKHKTYVSAVAGGKFKGDIEFSASIQKYEDGEWVDKEYFTIGQTPAYCLEVGIEYALKLI